MAAEAILPNELSKRVDLSAALADAILDAQIMGRPVTEEQTRALAKAARLLRENDVPWPPLLSQVLHTLAQSAGEIAYETPAGRPVGSSARILRFPS